MQFNNHTFVIPAYKQSAYLELCIKSLLAQTVKSDIILTTSTPSAYLEDIALSYNLPYFINLKSEGIAGDWNFALAKADTQYVTIAHQDDIYRPSYTETVISAMDGHGVSIAFTAYADLIENTPRIRSINALVKKLLLFPFAFSKTIKSKFFKKAILALGDPICCPSVTFNRELLQNFSFSTDYTCALDWFAWYELAKQPGAFLYISKELVKHRIHPASETTAQLANGKRAEEELKLFELIWGRPIAGIMTRLYKMGHKGNRV
jgi:glycosyltransferase involved in cell wall biosynthesis